MRHTLTPLLILTLASTFLPSFGQGWWNTRFVISMMYDSPLTDRNTVRARFQDAIDAVVGSYSQTMVDAKVIAACDGIDAKVKAYTETKYTGSVKINRYKSDENGFTTIKEYNY